MFENIHNVIIKGEHFSNRTILGNVLDKRINVLFGRNGSGKSTIARAMAELANPELQAENKSFQTIELDQPLSDDQRRGIYVFNEDFIEKYVKIEDDALGPIVMLGDQVEIAAQITAKELQIATLQTEYETESVNNAKLKDENHSSSPLFRFKSLKSKLTAADDWAERDSKCRVIASRHNSPVSEDTILYLLSVSDDNPLTEEEYNARKTVFEREYRLFCSAAGRTSITFKDSTIHNLLDLGKLQQLLLRSVQKPELTERDRHLMHLVANDLTKLKTTYDIFKNELTDVCPVCFRPITTDEKTDICGRISSILNQEVADYKSALDNNLYRLTDQVYSYSALDQLFPNECKSVKVAINDYNITVGKCREVVENREKNIFEAYTGDVTKFDIERCVKDFNSAVAKLKSVVDTYNRAINDRNNSAVSLKSTNTLLTAHKYKNELLEYRTALGCQEHSNTILAAKKSELETAKSELLVLQQSLEQTHLALDFINECLAYIYFSKSRLVLEEGEGCYRLKSNGVVVKPGHVSIGERNIIALCYFFARLFDHIKKEDQYKQEVLLVIDDPISSFDMENRMGVMSFLRWQIGMIYAGNNNSKVLIMSHDL